MALPIRGVLLGMTESIPPLFAIQVPFAARSRSLARALPPLSRVCALDQRMAWIKWSGSDG